MATETQLDFEQVFEHPNFLVDRFSNLPTSSLCGYLLHTADNHAAEFGLSSEDLLSKNQSWSLTRIHLEIDQPVSSGGELRVVTRPTGALRNLAGRDFQVFDSSNEEIARASTFWVIIDRTTRTPVALPDVITEIESPDRSPLVRSLGNITQPKGDSRETVYTVRWGDIDSNGHAGATSYVRWIANSLPTKYLSTNRLRTLQLSFQEEVLDQDVVHVRVADDDEGGFIHSLCRGSDGHIVAMAHTHWTPRSP